jgi:ribose-phosphate pyrophosphokinase
LKPCAAKRSFSFNRSRLRQVIIWPSSESIKALLTAGARPEIIVAATHGVFVRGAREKLSHPAVRAVLVTDTVRVTEQDWPQLHVVSIAPLIAGAVKQIVADGSLVHLH